MATVFLSWAKKQPVKIEAGTAVASGTIDNLGALSLGGPGTTQIQSIVVDVVPQETHTMESDVTHSPVETGVDVTDHIRPKPRTYAIANGLVSECPLTSSPGETPDPSAPGQAYQALVEIWESQALLTITTAIERYDNMVMVSCPVTRTVKDGDSLRFSATFEEIQIVQSQTVSVPAIPKGKPKAELGKVQATPQLTSTAVDLRDGAAKAFNLNLPLGPTP